MKFIQAKERLKELAQGRYHALGFELTEYAGGGLETECYLYIDSKISARAPTWESAFIKLEQELGIRVTKTEEVPEV